MSDAPFVSDKPPVDRPEPSPEPAERSAQPNVDRPNNDRRWVKLGVGAAIGSAAIAAALLYANRSSRNDRS